MKVLLFMACTVNGMIARKNGEEDFLSDENWKTFSTLAEKCGCFVIGRKTYQTVQKWKEYNFDSVTAKKIVVSGKGVKLNGDCFVASSPKDALTKAEALGVKTLLLTGGGKLNSSFIKMGLIDEVVLNVNPILLGQGIALFSEESFEKELKLISVKKLAEGIVQVRYKVLG